jgi:anhydro-N-acetylmuramic acid kinase
MASRKTAGRQLVGLISGTSMDGVDAALVRVTGPHTSPRGRVQAFLTLPYPAALRRRLLEIAAGVPTTSGELSGLNFLLGEWFARAALQVCRRARVSPRHLAGIGSHGQTLFHQGTSRRRAAAPWSRAASTLQLGEPAVIAARTGAPVVADFRTADLAAGGEGAPLVPMVDYLLLRDARQGRVALNIGGIANLTAIPAAASPARVFGFDTGPGNMLMDGLARHFSRGREAYDRNGRLARRGKVIAPLVAELLRFPFFRRRPPKSAGREEFGAEFLARYFLRRRGASKVDLLRTALELTARTITDAIRQFVTPQAAVGRLIVSGGGARNPLLLERLSSLLPQVSVELSDRYGLPLDAKEAVAFALLADRTLHGLSGNLPSVTGARRAVILGKTVRL